MGRQQTQAIAFSRIELAVEVVANVSSELAGVERSKGAIDP
jgi:hypothetical protein